MLFKQFKIKDFCLISQMKMSLKNSTGFFILWQIQDYAIATRIILLHHHYPQECAFLK